MEKITKWLLEQEPWIRYRTRIDLLDEPISLNEVIAEYEALVTHPLIQSVIQEIAAWPGSVMKRHNDAKLLFHKLAFMADIGISKDHPVIASVLNKILESTSADGPFQIVGNIPTAFGGSGQNQQIWMLCDAPIISYSLVKMGLNEDFQVQKSINYLLSLIQDFGWPCSATSELGKKFKGPGKRTHPCPYANLIMLRLIACLPELKNGYEAHTGTEMLLNFWDKRKETKYFLFGMGTDFNKLKAPFIWFDILHVAEVLSHFSFVYADKRFIEMIDSITYKADNSGLYQAESVYRAWNAWDFGQKKGPSAWISFLVYRILKRIKQI